ncbi:integral membrane TerC family protein [Striga hermonthica]|uniref:Integral membrane TerC family protein n=1 Tax=Striga hermonthica TaxID=68872 RepID=A0A9N7NIE4_STRHE|nr:integral membrane TerC family protein [Striga hermonthica]
MKLASSIHTNSIQIHCSFHLNLLKPSSIASLKSAPARFSLRNSLRGAPNAHSFPIIACARRAERGAWEASTSRNDDKGELIFTGKSNESSRFQSPEGTDGDLRSCDDASDEVLGEIASTSGDYANCLRTVGLCVFSAVAFGVGLGLKDGIGKASEFFAGYLLEQSLSVDNLFVFVLIFKYFKVPLSYQVHHNFMWVM